ncbi:MAG TPA: hypothetical protein DCM54_17335 [Gammaproteobacteria bacterium]|nr:hypothetical protein [Gammaproteobacteria bacterium]|tara:strand:- start:103 stop:543 length:441 start_codon:yes stop_codon:yes gene_type:complete
MSISSFIKVLVVIVSCVSYAAMPAIGQELLKPVTPLVAPEILPVDEAFNISIHKNKGSIEVHWRIAPGYYLYRDKLSFSVDQPPKMDSGVNKVDEYFGEVEVYFMELVVNLPISSELLENEQLLVGFQGCAEAGFCYPPQKRSLSL